MEDDPFDSILNLESQFYDEGYALGVADGTRAGHVEGRVFGLEKGFEKFIEMGKLHGRSLVWASRLPRAQAESQTSVDVRQEQKNLQSEHEPRSPESVTKSLPPLAANARLEKHVQTFHALVELESLSTQNGEDDISEFDDRLRRAMGKAKVIEKLIGEEYESDASSAGDGVLTKAGDGSIEDISILHARH
ncbi:hypothetical protein MMC34_002006 [Xylographa carneopallida]|nr:hypothetical protein [Xylographa carneopallida]